MNKFNSFFITRKTRNEREALKTSAIDCTKQSLTDFFHFSFFFCSVGTKNIKNCLTEWSWMKKRVEISAYSAICAPESLLPGRNKSLSLDSSCSTSLLGKVLLQLLLLLLLCRVILRREGVRPQLTIAHPF